MIIITEKEKKPKKASKEPKKEEKDLKETLQRLQAEFENYKKRVERDRNDLAKYSSESIIKKFLPILDNLELALKHCTQKDDFYKGIELIYASIREMLSSEGLKPIPALGLPFDPYRHEALMSNKSDKQPNTVIEEMQKGYMLTERVIRPTKVIISKGG